MIQELLHSRSEILEELRILDERIREEKLRLSEEVHGVKIGSIVEYKGKKHRVTKINVSYAVNGAKPWVEGNPMRRDGTYGSGRRCLYSEWTLAD